MSDTPRTDAASLKLDSDDSSCAIYAHALDGSSYYGEVVRGDEMAKLERENAAMREELAQVKKHLREANKGAETNAKISWSMAGKLNAARDENAAMRAGLAEAYKIIDILYMDALDNHKESWPRARAWMEQWKEVAK